MEVGAAWITTKDPGQGIFTINGYRPEDPLKIKDKRVSFHCNDVDQIITLSTASIISFCKKILDVGMSCGYTGFKDFNSNKEYLIKNYVTEWKGN